MSDRWPQVVRQSIFWPCKPSCRRRKNGIPRLDALAQGFSDLGLTADGQHCRELASPMATTLFRIQKPPKEVQAEIPQTLPEKERELRLSLRKLQDEYAAELYTLSRKALRAGYPSYAFQIVQEIVRHNPDHVAAPADPGIRAAHE